MSPPSLKNPPPQGAPGSPMPRPELKCGDAGGVSYPAGLVKASSPTDCASIATGSDPDVPAAKAAELAGIARARAGIVDGADTPGSALPLG